MNYTQLKYSNCEGALITVESPDARSSLYVNYATCRINATESEKHRDFDEQSRTNTVVYSHSMFM